MSEVDKTTVRCDNFNEVYKDGRYQWVQCEVTATEDVKPIAKVRKALATKGWTQERGRRTFGEFCPECSIKRAERSRLYWANR